MPSGRPVNCPARAGRASIRRAAALAGGVVIAMLLVSCTAGEIELTQLASSSGSHTALTGHSYEPTDPKHVRIYARPPAGKYKVIARVASTVDVADRTEAGEQQAILYKRLRVEAAKAGANGVIDVHEQRSAITPSQRMVSYDATLTGKAIRLPHAGNR